VRALILCLLLSACDLGEGKGALAGTLFVRACTSDSDYGMAAAPRAYDMQPRYFVATPVDDLQRPFPMNRLSIRVQPSGNRVEEADAMLIDISNDRDVAVLLGQDIAVGPSTNVRATLNLNATCPAAEVEMELDGTINWSKFGGATTSAVPEDFNLNYGDRITANFSFDVVDRRAIVLGGVGGVSPDPAVGGHLTGYFDFVIRQGQAGQSP